MTFWGTDLVGKNVNFKEPKRKHRFLVEFGSEGFLLATKSIKKPTVNFENKEYKMINHHFSYPGIPKWESIELSLVDANVFLATKPEGGNNTGIFKRVIQGKARGFQSTNTASRLWEMLLASGYSTPNSTYNAEASTANTINNVSLIRDDSGGPNKRDMASVFGYINIYQIDEGELTTGRSVINYLEKWTLKNPIIERISWGELSYAEEDLVQCDMSIKFDWPEFESGPKKLHI